MLVGFLMSALNVRVWTRFYKSIITYPQILKFVSDRSQFPFETLPEFSNGFEGHKEGYKNITCLCDR